MSPEEAATILDGHQGWIGWEGRTPTVVEATCKYGVRLDGEFTISQLEAIILLMKAGSTSTVEVQS